ncbi:MAG: autotransporter-associated beta strand repeat-containing protein, partial [Roseimicrobium sp.]
MRTLRRFRAPIGVLLAFVMAMWQIASPLSVSAATYYWDINGATPGAGGPVVTGDWNSTLGTNWSTDPTGSSATAAWAGTGADTAVFSAGTDATGASVVTINQGGNIVLGALTVQEGNITINAASANDKLQFSNSAFLDGSVNVSAGSRLTVNAEVTGNAGLTKVGNGTLALTNNSNSYTGQTVINAGSLVITNNAQLGASTTTVAASGIASTGSFNGGQLVVQGGVAGTTISRDISVIGRGPSAANASGALISVGNNTFSGTVLLAGPASESRMASVYGTTTMTGQVVIGSGQGSLFYGNGNFVMTGQVTGFDAAQDRFIKTGLLVGTTLWLANNTNNFLSSIRIDSGTVRVSANGALGLNTTNIAVDLNNGALEIRTDALDFGTRKVRVRDFTTGTIFVDHAVGSSLINQTVAFSDLAANNNSTTFTFTGRNGYGASFTGLSGTIGAGGGGNATINNSSNGILFLNGNLWGQNDGTARVLTIQGNSETVVSGSILAPNAAAHAFTKAGSGTLTFIQGTADAASTFKGNTSINDGMLEIRTVKILNDTAASRIILGGGGLSYLGDTTTGAGETFTNKTFDLNAGTGIILANQAGTAPTAIILPNNFASTSTAAKTLVLGGSSTLNNTIQGVISNNTNLTSVTKVGPGTWQIDGPTAANYGTASTGLATTNTSGQATFTVASTAGLVVGQPISGAGVPVGAVITQINNGTTFTISAVTTAAVASVNLAPVSGNTAGYAASTNAANVVTVGSTAGLVVGQSISGTGIDPTGNWYISQITSATTFTIASATGAAALGNGTVTGALTLGSSANFAGTLAITGGVLRLNATSASGDAMNNTSGVTFAADTAITNLGSAGGTFEYAGFSSGSSETVGRLTPTAGLGIVKVTSGVSPATLTFLDLGARGAGSILNFQPGTGTISFATPPTLTNGIINGSTLFNGVDWATMVGNDVAAYTGYTVTTGTIATGATQNIKVDNTSAGNVTMAASGNTDIFTLLANDAAARTIDVGTGNTLRIGTTLGGILVTAGSGGLTIGVAGSAGTLTTQSATSEIVLYNDAAVTINSVIANNTATSLTKGGSGVLSLNGNNTFTGGVVVNQGSIVLGHVAGLGVNGNVTLRPSTSLNLAGFAATINGLAGSGNVTNSGAAAIFSIGSANGSSVFAGVIANGAGTITMQKLGTGTIALTGLNTYTGGTIISNGTLIVTNLANGGLASSLGQSSNAASNLILGGAGTTGTLNYTGSSTTIYQTTKTPTVSIDRLFSLAGNGTIQSNGTYGNESVAAAGVQNNAALLFSNSGPIGFTTAGVKTLTLGGTSIGDNIMGLRLIDNTIDATALSVTKADAGLWILGNATNSYTGVTTISAGALQAVDGTSLPTASNLLLNGGVFQTFGTFDRAIGTGADQFRWNTNGSGGFSASTDRLFVNIGGAGVTLDWGTGGIGNGTGTLILSSTTALFDTVFVNGINLNGANRTIQVDDNGSTGLDYATIQGVISNGTGTAGFTKSGGGILILNDANTYNGNTTLNNGTLVIQSFGNSSGTTSGSLGASGGSFVFSNGTTGVNLIYAGAGEVATRPITISSGASTIRIDSSGSGALVLGGAITNSATGAVTLELRGLNTDFNRIDSVLANSGANVLTVTKADGGVWVLNPGTANTFTGNINISGGQLGLTANGIGAAAGIVFSNGALFAYGGPLAFSKNVTLANNTTAVFAGQYDITVTGNVIKSAGVNEQTLNNSLENGAVLTINGNYVNNETATATRLLQFRGFGSTVWNGIIQNNSGTSLTGINISMANNAMLTLSGAANTYTGGTTIGQGILLLNKVGALGPSGTFSLSGGEIRAGVDLSGAVNKIVNAVALTGDPVIFSGSNNIELGSATALTMGASRHVVNNIAPGTSLIISSGVTNTAAATLTISGSGTTLISSNVGTGTGAQALTYSGTGTLTLTGANTMTGTLTVNRGLVVMSGTTGGSVNAATAVAINAGGILRLDNSGGDNVAGRIAARPVTIQGGVLELIGDADGTTETAAALAVNSATASIVMSGAGPNVLRFASVAFNNTGSSLDLGGIAGLGTTNKVIFTTEPTESPVSTGILSRVFIGGNDFATHNSTDGVVAFTGYNNTNDLALAANTDTMNLTASANVANTRTLNALKINGSGLNIGGSGYTLTLTSGGVLNTGGNNTLSMEYLAFGGNAAFFQVKSGTTLTVNSAITGSGGLSKALGGTMILNSGTFMSSTTNVLDGTLVLNAGLNTLYAGSQVLSFGASGIVDLNGNVQYTGQISSAGGMPNTGGLITSGTGTGTLVTNMVGTATYAGQLTGANVNLVRLNGNTLTLESALTYGGQTHLLGGTTGLENDAALVNTTSIDINQATLSLNNNSSLQTNNNNRINDAATITLRGGTLTLNGRVNTATSEVLGALTVAQGGNTISSNWGGTGTFGTFSSADLTFASFSRAAGTTVNFTGSNLGSQGNNARINFGVPLAVVGPGVLGAWAIANTTDYAAYNPVNGVGVVGAGGYASYDLGFASGNITNVGGTSTVALTTTLSGTTTTGMLRLAGAFSNDIAFTTNTDVLNLEYGGLLRSNNNNTSLIGTTAIRGILTAGGGLTSGTTELVVYNAQSTTTINSVIANNGLGNTLAFVKSGAGTVALSAANTYTGGTTVNQGVLQLVGDVGTIVIPAGGLTLTGATVTMVTNGGQIEASNDVTLNGSSTLTLVGNNTLGSLTFNNNGGSGNPTVTVGGILTLTDAAAVTVTTSNAMTLPVISGGTLALGAGVKTFDIGAPTAAGQAYTTFHPSLSITSIITGTATINKTGNGLLQLSGQSTFSGGLNVMAGGIIVGANSTATTLSTPGGLVSGPLGTGAVNMAVGTRLLVDNTSRTVANAITFNGNPIFDNTGLGTVTLALNGPITLPNGALSVNVIAPNLTAALAGTITNIGSITSITKTGLGNLSVNITGLGSTVPITMESGGALTLLHDGDGTGGIQTIPLGAVTFDGFPILTIGRAGTSTYYATAANKILAPTSITSLANGITLTASNGYGLLVADNIALNNGNLFTITGASNSNVVQALTLNGVVSGASSGLTKAGNGTLVLNNNANSFGGAGAVILINQGVIAVSQDSQLGNASNIIRLSPTAGTSTLRVQGTFATNRTIDLGSTANTRAIDVTGNNVFTLNTAFTHSGGVTAGLQKLNQGTLVLTQAQTGWDGVLTITQGTVRFANSGAAGTTVGGVSLANVAAGIELTGGITIADALTLTTGDNNTSNGMRGAGAIRSLVGTNTWSGLITMGTTGGDSTVRAATFTADAGATLNLTGGLVANLGTSGSNRDAFYAFGGAGTVNLTSTITHNNTFGVFTLSKFGTGTLNIQVANAFTGQQVFIKQGTLSLNGAGTLGVPTVGAPGTVNINQDGILTLDNVTTNVANRLSNRNMVIQGGFFNILGSAAGATNETTTGTLNFASGGSVITLTAGAGQQVNFTSGAITRSAASTVLFRGSNLGNVAGADTATIQATGTGYVVVGQAGATGTTNKGILPWGIIDTTTTGSGTSFATVDSVNGRVRALAAGEFVTTITGALANFENVRLSTTQNGLNSGFTQLPQTINSLQLNAGGGTAFGDMRALTIDSGGILALAGNTGILGGLLSTSTNREMIIHNTGDLEISSAIVSFNGGLTKTGAGILTLSSSFNNFTGQVTINEGTVKLAGGNNTIFPGQNMVLQGGALDLNGTVQRFNALFAQNVSLARGDYYAENTAGTVINTSGTQALLALSTANVNFIGRIGNDTVSDSDIAVLRGQGAGAYQDWNLNGNNTYTGATLFNGGRVQILDNGRLSGTSSIELSHATLLIGASNTSTELIDNTLDRVNNAATILIRGGMLQFRGRAGLDYSEDLGDVILAEGNAFFDIAEPGTAINSAVITLASLERQANSHATLRIVNVDGTIGSLARVYITDAPVLTNNIIGGWAVYERDFASYTTGTGLGALNTGGYAGYSPNTIHTGLTTDNIRLTTIGTTTLTGNRNINALAMVVAGATTLDLGGFTLTLGSGGLIASNATDTTNITIQNGSITSGTLNNPSELFIHALSWQNNADTTNRDVILNASVVDNGTGPVTLVVVGDSGRGAGYGTNQVILQANNTHTGGTIFNSGNSVLNLAGANGTTLNAVPGDLTITGGTANLDSDFRAHSATVTLLASDQIKHTANLTLLGGSTLNLNNFNQTLAGVTFNNTGGNTPTLAIGTGTFRLNGNITATSQNISTASAITSSGVGNMNLNGATRTFNVDAVKWNGQVIDPLLVTLNISALIQGTGSEGIIKTGDGLLQLSAQNTFTGGVDLQQGGIAIGGSSTPSTLGAIVTTGPLGSGTFKIGANTYLTSTGTNTLANNLNLNNNLTFRGANSLTFNGNATLTTGGTFTVNVEEANFTAVFNGLINANADFGLVKNGFGTLRLSNYYNQVSGVTLNQGTLDLFSTGLSTTSQIGNAGITMNGGLLMIRNNGGGGTPVGVVIDYGNDLTLGAALTDAQIHIGNASAGTNNLIQLGKLTTTVNNQGVSLSAANGYNLRFIGADINTQARFAIQSATTLTVLLSNVGVSQSVTGLGTIVAGGDNYVNTGAGTLVVGVGVKANTTTDMPGGPFNFAPGTNTFIPLAGTLSNAGYTQGGLLVRQTSYAATQNLNSVVSSGVGPTATFTSITPPGDTAYNNRPPSIITTVVAGAAAQFGNSIATYSGLLQITAGGTYSFRTSSDDQAVLFIDGVMVLSDNVNGGGHGLTETGTATIELSAGYHSIVFMGQNATGGGGFNILYAGPDTSGNNITNGFQSIDPDKLYYTTNLGSVANGFLNAAIISDAYNLPSAQASTLDGQGTHFNLMFGSLTLGATSTLTVQNQFGTGYYGVVGTTTIGGAGAIVNPTTGTLYLAGGVNDGAALGLTKNGAGSLYLGTSTNFTGTFTMNSGFVLLAGANALSTGSNIVNSGVHLDLYGNSSGGSVTLNGGGMATL